MRELELLAPARNADIGIAAIDCGADAVYMAGPAFGARQAAGNSMEDIAKVCRHASRFGARVFLTLNTILYDNELKEAEKILKQAREAGIDAVIAQDPAVWKLTDLPIHASTQCAVRSAGKARMLEALGASRIILEREMSLEDIRKIRSQTGCELEFFVHGALCVCYSGQCYMSESICSRSANRGACIQACRSLYDLVDTDGKIISRNKALLSLKDYCLIDRLPDLASAGVSSFKIEGRLKNMTYVKNVVSAYSSALDSLAAEQPEEYRRASFGHVRRGFIPDLGKTFNRGYTQLFLDGKRGCWSSMDSPKPMGEFVGKVVSSKRSAHDSKTSTRIALELAPGIALANGDGFSFLDGEKNEIIGFRGDVCQGSIVYCKDVPSLKEGVKIYRNQDGAFEKKVERSKTMRLVPVSVHLSVKPDGHRSDYPAGQLFTIKATASSQDGRIAVFEETIDAEAATDAERMSSLLAGQFGKTTGDYSFSLDKIETDGGILPMLPASRINGMRRELASELDSRSCAKIPLHGSGKARISADSSQPILPFSEINDGESRPDGCLSYKANISNHMSREAYSSLGAEILEDAYEISHADGAELMRTKYCIRYELGLCPVRQGAVRGKDLFLLNNGRRYRLGFDCKKCEMTVKAD